MPSMSRSLTVVHRAPVTGSKARPLGLRRPVANTRSVFVARVSSRMLARLASAAIPPSAMFELEPTVM